MWGRIISTHALTEGDFFLISFTLCYFDFNSRPHGGRPSTCRHWLSGLLFQLTPSRRVTLKLSKGGRLTIISTHALTEGDPEKQGIQESSVNFNSRPHGGRQILLPPEVGKNHISTHALTEGDAHITGLKPIGLTFQLTPSRRATRVSLNRQYL